MITTLSSLVRDAYRSTPLPQWRARLKGERPWQNYRRLFARDVAPRLARVKPASPARRILFWSPLSAWSHTLIENTLATHLRMRGHEVVAAFCDGGQPHCCLERSGFARPLCNVCEDQSLYNLQSFQRPFVRLSEHVTKAQQQEVMAQCNAMSPEALRAFTCQEIPLGAQAVKYLTTYYNGFVPFDEHVDTARRLLAGEWLYTMYAERVAASFRPDVVFMFSGQDTQFYGPFRRFRQLGIPTVTWDESPQWPDGFYFSHDACAGDVPLSPLWPEASQRRLSPSERAATLQYLEDWRSGRASVLSFHPNPQRDVAVLRERLGLPEGKPVVVAFSNVVWDSNVITKNVGFRDMREWLATLVEWFTAHPQFCLVLRAHPGEARTPPEFRTRGDSTLPALVNSVSPQGLPDNIRLVPAEDNADSYVLGELADAVTTYTTNIGFELALRRKAVWVAGQAIYRGKGFTRDLTGPGHLRQVLDQGGWCRPLPDEQHDLALCFLHLWVFRHIVRIPYRRRDRTNQFSDVHFKDFKFLLPGGDEQLDAMSESLLQGRPFLDIPRRSSAVWKQPGETRWQTAAEGDGI